MERASVGIIMGSDSDWPTMQHAAQILKRFNVDYRAKVVSAHRTPQLLAEYAEQAIDQGFKIIIAGAGGAAHLPGMVASQTLLPVIGVPIKSTNLAGIDSLLSIVQMPAGVPVATMAIGDPGAKNAAWFSLRLLALNDQHLQQQLARYLESENQKIRNINLPELTT